jgi:hypothetical protein
MAETLKKPVVFIIFNRPDTTARVFQEIARAKPEKLLVIADGPRADRPGEAEACFQARAVVEQGLDWDCEVLVNYADRNLGCKKRVSSGLNWAFDQVEEAIILEDDCLPDATFFRFCSELLDRYRDETRVFMISGDNFQLGKKRTSDSYYFSQLTHIWGWASWRRAWRLYDSEMSQWAGMRDSDWLLHVLKDRKWADHWQMLFDVTFRNGQTWDYQLQFACWLNQMLAIQPDRNLISNIGFGEQATHTSEASWVAGLATVSMRFPLQHPTSIVQNSAADRFVIEKIIEQDHPGFFKRLKGRLHLELESLKRRSVVKG